MFIFEESHNPHVGTVNYSCTNVPALLLLNKKKEKQMNQYC